MGGGLTLRRVDAAVILYNLAHLLMVSAALVAATCTSVYKSLVTASV